MIISIEIDNYNIKIIEALKKGETLSVSRCTLIDIDYGIKDGKIIDMSLIVNLINETLKKNSMRTKRAVFIINSTNIMIRVIKLPLLKKSSEILSMLQIELQQIISADLSKYKIVYEVSKIINENKITYADYIVYCIPVILVNQYIELAEKSKLKLIKIDISPRCINLLYKNNIKINNCSLNIEETIAFIYLKENSISFSVANNGFCDFHISSEFEENIVERVAESQSLYLYSDNYLAVDNTITSQIAKFMRYYYSVSNNRLINKIYIYGNLSPDIDKAIKTKLNMDVEIIDNLSNITTNKKILDIFKLNKYFITVLAWVSNCKGVNFNTARNKSIKHNYGYVAFAFVIIAALGILPWFFNSQILMRDKIETMSLYIDNGENNEINSEIEIMKKEIEYLENYLNIAEKLQKVIKDNDYVDSYTLRKINMSKPSNTKVTSIYLSKDSTQLQCVSSSMSEATLFFHNLKEIELVESVYIPAIQSKTGQGFSYSIILKLKDVIEHAN